MPFRSIVAEPDQIEAMQAAFERAWQLVEERGELDPLQVPAQRERLAYIIIGQWETDRDGDLVAPAIARFFAATDPLSTVVESASSGVKEP
jgi:hypothetical protein